MGFVDVPKSPIKGGDAGPSSADSAVDEGYHPVTIGGLVSPSLPDGFYDYSYSNSPATGLRVNGSTSPALSQLAGSKAIWVVGGLAVAGFAVWLARR